MSSEKRYEITDITTAFPLESLVAKEIGLSDSEILDEFSKGETRFLAIFNKVAHSFMLCSVFKKNTSKGLEKFHSHIRFELKKFSDIYDSASVFDPSVDKFKNFIIEMMKINVTSKHAINIYILKMYDEDLRGNPDSLQDAIKKYSISRLESSSSSYDTSYGSDYESSSSSSSTRFLNSSMEKDKLSNVKLVRSSSLPAKTTYDPSITSSDVAATFDHKAADQETRELTGIFRFATTDDEA